MAKEAQDIEWSRAQQIAITVDLVKAAKEQLQFLAVIDSIHNLYDGPALDHAIYRYKYCWLPFLAKHAISPIVVDALVVPLDCEWIWHCHRLNPVQYKIDCEKIFGRILDNLNAISTTKATCTKQTEAIWNPMYPSEPYHVKLGSRSVSVAETNEGDQRSTEYDLVAAVKRQSSFFQKVSKSITDDDCFLQEAVARYRAFLHLIKTKQNKSITSSCAPAADIDLIWHSHQLYPLSYNNDLNVILGKTLDHNDRDSLNGDKLKIGFADTTKLWEVTFGRQYLMTRLDHTYGNPVAECEWECVNGTYSNRDAANRCAIYSVGGFTVIEQSNCCDGCVDGSMKE